MPFHCLDPAWIKRLSCVGFCLLLFGCDRSEHTIVLQKPKPKAKADVTLRKEVRMVAFGSCAHADEAMPVLDVAIDLKPDVFVWLGDNIYGDTYDMEVLAARYAQLDSNPYYQRLRNSTRNLAVWDDHDYGWNDVGRHYPQKAESKSLFVDFWGDPDDAPRRERPGIYMSYLFDGGRQDVHVILLDTRTFRDNLRPAGDMLIQATTNITYKADYTPHAQPSDSTLLGRAQWSWFEKQLDVDADYRIIATSTQFGIEWNGYECWANFPHERERMCRIISEDKSKRKTMGKQSVPTVFISGDVHYAEISGFPMPQSPNDTLYDVTSSGITSRWDFATPNAFRTDGPIMENNIGVLKLGRPGKAAVVAEIWDASGERRIEKDLIRN